MCFREISSNSISVPNRKEHFRNVRTAPYRSFDLCRHNLAAVEDDLASGVDK